MKLNNPLKKIIKSFSQTSERSTLQEYFSSKNQELKANQQSLIFRANRFWNQGNQLKNEDIKLRSSFSIPEMSKGQYLCSEAITECIRNFTSRELIYFNECVQLSVKKRREIVTCPDELNRLTAIECLVKSDFSN